MGLVSIPKHIVLLILRTEASYWVVLGDRDIGQWWTTQEVNLLGTLNFVGYGLAMETLCGSLMALTSPSLKHLSKTNGYVIAISSIGAQLRSASASDYGSQTTT